MNTFMFEILFGKTVQTFQQKQKMSEEVITNINLLFEIGKL